MPKRAKQISFRKCPLTTVIKCHREKPDNVRLILSLPENFFARKNLLKSENLQEIKLARSQSILARTKEGGGNNSVCKCSTYDFNWLPEHGNELGYSRKPLEQIELEILRRTDSTFPKTNVTSPHFSAIHKLTAAVQPFFLATFILINSQFSLKTLRKTHRNRHDQHFLETFVLSCSCICDSTLRLKIEKCNFLYFSILTGSGKNLSDEKRKKDEVHQELKSLIKKLYGSATVELFK